MAPRPADGASFSVVDRNALTVSKPSCMLSSAVPLYESGREHVNYHGLRDRIATRSSLERHPSWLFLPSVL